MGRERARDEGIVMVEGGGKFPTVSQSPVAKRSQKASIKQLAVTASDKDVVHVAASGGRSALDVVPCYKKGPVRLVAECVRGEILARRMNVAGDPHGLGHHRPLSE